MGDSNSQMSHSVKDQKQNVSDDEMGKPPFFIRLTSPSKKGDNSKIAANDTEDSHNSPGTSNVCLKNSSREDGNEKNEKPVKVFSKNYMMWENNSNLCWLDASMALLAHNKFLHLQIDTIPSSQIFKIIKCYDASICELNDFTCEKKIEFRLKDAREKLKIAQESSLTYLKPKVKCKEGEPDSAFCSLYNLINEAPIRDLFDVGFSWLKDCEKCKVHRSRSYKKPIITLAKVKAFCPVRPVSICQCPDCKEPDQKMILAYKKLPVCLIFHFESGAGQGKFKCLDFELNSRNYELTGVMVLEKCQELLINHFVTWIRDPVTNCWLECNDLNPEIKKFSPIAPDIKLEDIYIITYEAVDKLGTNTKSSDVVSGSQVKCSENNETCDAKIPFIDLSDEADEKAEKQNSDIGKSILNQSNQCNMLEPNYNSFLVKQATKNVTIQNLDESITTIVSSSLGDGNTALSKASQDTVTSDPDWQELDGTEPNAESVAVTLSNEPASKIGKTIVNDNSMGFHNIQEVQTINESKSLKCDKITTKDNSMKLCDNQVVHIIENFEEDIGKSYFQVETDNYDVSSENGGKDIQMNNILSSKGTRTVNETIITDSIFNKTVDQTNTELSLKNLTRGLMKKQVASIQDSDTKSSSKLKETSKEASSYKEYQKEDNKNILENTFGNNKRKVSVHAIANDQEAKESKITAKSLSNVTIKTKNDTKKNESSEKTIKLDQISNSKMLGKRKIPEVIERIDTIPEKQCRVSTDKIRLSHLEAFSNNECSSVEIESSKMEDNQNNQLDSNEISILKEVFKSPVQNNLCEIESQMFPGEAYLPEQKAKMPSSLEEVESSTNAGTCNMSPRRKVTPMKQCYEIKSSQVTAKETDLCNKEKQLINDDLAVIIPKYSTRKLIQSPNQSFCKEILFEGNIVNSEPKQVTNEAKNQDAGLSHVEQNKTPISKKLKSSPEKKKIPQPNIPFNTKTRSMKASTQSNSVFDFSKKLDGYDTLADKTSDLITRASPRKSKNTSKSGLAKKGRKKCKNGNVSDVKSRKIKELLPDVRKFELYAKGAGKNSIITLIGSMPGIADSEKKTKDNIHSNENGTDKVTPPQIGNTLESTAENPNEQHCGYKHCHCCKDEIDNTVNIVVDYMSTGFFKFFGLEI